jgi:hypothetical protein
MRVKNGSENSGSSEEIVGVSSTSTPEGREFWAKMNDEYFGDPFEYVSEIVKIFSRQDI